MYLPFWVIIILAIGVAFGFIKLIRDLFFKKEPRDNDEKKRRDFVANVSHELRTPVSIIKGFADSLIEDYALLNEDKRKSFLSKIQKNSERLNNLVEDLLALAKLEEPQTTLEISKFDLCEVLNNIKEDFSQRKIADPPKLFLKGKIKKLLMLMLKSFLVFLKILLITQLFMLLDLQKSPLQLQKADWIIMSFAMWKMTVVVFLLKIRKCFLSDFIVWTRVGLEREEVPVLD